MNEDLLDEAIGQQDAMSILQYVYSFYRSRSTCMCGRERSARFLQLSRLTTTATSCRTARITGTNGKGTTAIRLEQMLRLAGHETICLTSPHLYSVRERVRIAGRPITWNEVAGVLTRIGPVLEAMRNTDWHPRPTDLWAWCALRLQIDRGTQFIGIYEVGKGGATDAINVFDNGIVALTNLGRDHWDDFGGTATALLNEKLGLCSDGDTLIYGALGGEVAAMVQHFCNQQRLRCVPVDHSYRATVPGLDEEDQCNTALASAVAEAMGCEVTRVSASAHLPARIESRRIAGREFILDGAHNVQAVERLVRRLAQRADLSRTLILGVQRKKEWRNLVDVISGIANLRLIACVEMTTGEACDSSMLSKYVSQYGITSMSFQGMVSCLAEVLRREWDQCVVVGSFKLFRDFELALHHLNLSKWAVPIYNIDPQQPWMRTIV